MSIMNDGDSGFETGDGGAGAIVVGVLVVVAIVVGLFFLAGTPRRGETIDISAPRVAVSVSPAG